MKKILSDNSVSLNTIYNMDCIDGMKLIPENSIDSIVTDPPYELGFMGKSWDSTGIANNVEMRSECLRILKPWGHLLAFSGTRTYHRMASAIEDAGFEVRDMIEWVYWCLSEDTEILTENGWKKYNKIKKDDLVFAYDREYERKIVVEPIKEIYIYDYDEEAYHIKDTWWYESDKLKQTDHIVSKNHNIIVSSSSRILKTSISDSDKKIKAEDLYKLTREKNCNDWFCIPWLNGYIPCTIEKIPYNGKVWCIEVESGAFIARRNWKIFITGNSGFPKSLNIEKQLLKEAEKQLSLQTNDKIIWK